MPGKIQMIQTGTHVTISLNADTGTISAGGRTTQAGEIQAVGQGPGQDGELYLNDEFGNTGIFLSTKQLHLLLRARPGPGKLIGPAMVVLDAQTPELRLFGSSGDIGGGAHEATVHLRGSDAVVRAGGNGVDGRIIVLGKDSKGRISLEGSTGDIVLSNADCAEEFDIDEAEEVSPGSVMIIDESDRLRKCTSAYDKRVAGVLSGAGEYKPAIVLDRKAGPGRRIPIALVGKTYCQADAQYAPVELGDLLTTSPTAGFAMKATEAGRAFGAVIGKALRPLRDGRGLIPILVALQ